jgi:hypothetical protein
VSAFEASSGVDDVAEKEEELAAAMVVLVALL